MAERIVSDVFNVPLPARPNRGPKLGSVHSGFRKYLPDAAARANYFKDCEEASYNLASEYVGIKHPHFDGLRSFLKRHLSKYFNKA